QASSNSESKKFSEIARWDNSYGGEVALHRLGESHIASQKETETRQRQSDRCLPRRPQCKRRARSALTGVTTCLTRWKKRRGSAWAVSLFRHCFPLTQRCAARLLPLQDGREQSRPSIVPKCRIAQTALDGKGDHGCVTAGLEKPGAMMQACQQLDAIAA